MAKATRRSAKITIVVTGDEQINAALRKLSGPEAKKAIRQAARYALRPVLAAAKRLAPSRTGALRGGIRLMALKRSRSRIGARVTSGGRTNRGTATDYTGAVFYGAFLEYGWTPGKRGGKRGSRVAGLHFMKQAADSTQPEAMQRYQEFLGQRIEELAK
jgi:hypothetical protein